MTVIELCPIWSRTYFLKTQRPDLREPIIEAGIRRFRRQILDPSGSPEPRAEAVAFLISAGVDPAPRGNH